MSGPARIALAPDLARALAREAGRRGVGAEELADAALRAHLEGELEARREAPLLAAMEEVVAALGRVVRTNLVISETQAEHLRCFLTLAPPMRAGEADAARAGGNLLHEALCDHVQSRVAGGRTFLQAVAASGGAPARRAAGEGGAAPPGDAAGGARDDALLARFGEARRRIRRIEWEQVIMAELQACHLEHVLARSPPVHRDEEGMQRSLGAERFRHALRRISARVRAERPFLLGVVDAARPTERDFEEGPGPAPGGRDGAGEGGGAP